MDINEVLEVYQSVTVTVKKKKKPKKRSVEEQKFEVRWAKEDNLPSHPLVLTHELSMADMVERGTQQCEEKVTFDAGLESELPAHELSLLARHAIAKPCDTPLQ